MAKEIKNIKTRKIELWINSSDAEKAKEWRHQLFVWRDATRRLANFIAAHKYVQWMVRDFVYLKDDIKEKFYVQDCIKEGKGMSEQNVTYALSSKLVKDGVFDDLPSEIRACLNQSVANTIKERKKDIMRGDMSVPMYRNNIDVPFKGSSIMRSLVVTVDGDYTFKLFKIPLVMRFGRDRSNNQAIVDRCISGEYKVCGSSYRIEGKKVFLSLKYEMPVRTDVKLKDGKCLFARIGIETPLVYMVDIKAKQEFDSGIHAFPIGSKGYFYRRLKIQQKVHNIMKSAVDAKGGHGRARKLKAVEPLHKKEQKYVHQKMQEYSRKLVDAAVENKCSRIVLLDQERREDELKAIKESEYGKFVLRNWGYGGLKGLIEMKCRDYGIVVNSE